MIKNKFTHCDSAHSLWLHRAETKDIWVECLRRLTIFVTLPIEMILKVIDDDDFCIYSGLKWKHACPEV